MFVCIYLMLRLYSRVVLASTMSAGIMARGNQSKPSTGCWHTSQHHSQGESQHKLYLNSQGLHLCEAPELRFSCCVFRSSTLAVLLQIDTHRWCILVSSCQQLGWGIPKRTLHKKILRLFAFMCDYCFINIIYNFFKTKEIWVLVINPTTKLAKLETANLIMSS